MKFVSTKDRTHPVAFTDAITAGLAPDGGLFVPETLPGLNERDFPVKLDLPSIGPVLLRPFLGDDPLAAFLPDICREAFTFETPVVRLEGTPGPAWALELFHGPTSAFKDVGARFLAAALRRVSHATNQRLTILVATSGDTGGAVAAAFFRVEPFDVVLLYPKGMVSDRQAHQLSCWGRNVTTFRVRGTFDDCQRMVKQAFRDPALLSVRRFSSANSINIGRLLPQMVYYARASLQLFRETKRPPSFIVPSGNLGNVLACLWTRAAGLPIGQVVMATNKNSPVPEYASRGVWRPRAAEGTIASAMDVGDPSNMERLRLLFRGPDDFGSHVQAYAVSEDEIRETIRQDASTLGRVWCPHSATAAHVYRKLWSTDPAQPWVIVATAHPAKFNDVVEPLAGLVPIPKPLAELLKLPRIETELNPSMQDLREALLRN